MGALQSVPRTSDEKEVNTTRTNWKINISLTDLNLFYYIGVVVFIPYRLFFNQSSFTFECNLYNCNQTGKNTHPSLTKRTLTFIKFFWRVFTLKRMILAPPAARFFTQAPICPSDFKDNWGEKKSINIHESGRHKSSSSKKKIQSKENYRNYSFSFCINLQTSHWWNKLF